MARKNKEQEDTRKKQPGQENEEGEEEQKESFGSKLVLFIVTIFVIALWLAIIALLIKMDVGGFGSSVLRPVLKDVPYLSRILPDGAEDEIAPATEIDTEHMFDSIDAAVARIKELERQVDSDNETISSQKDTIKDLNAQVADLSKYKEEQAEFKKEKQKYYEEVVFGDEAPDINEYKGFYESIEPENAAVLYKQVVEQLQASEEVEDYVKAYSSMKPKKAAGIFDAMEDNLGLVAEILEHMESAPRGDIMAEMTPSIAAKVTAIMDPDIAADVQKTLANRN